MLAQTGTHTDSRSAWYCQIVHSTIYYKGEEGEEGEGGRGREGGREGREEGREGREGGRIPLIFDQLVHKQGYSAFNLKTECGGKKLILHFLNHIRYRLE